MTLTSNTKTEQKALAIMEHIAISAPSPRLTMALGVALGVGPESIYDLKQEFLAHAERLFELRDEAEAAWDNASE